MFHFITIVAFAFLMGGIHWRLRGSNLSGSTTTGGDTFNRIAVWGLLFAFVAVIVDANPLIPFAAWVLGYAGAAPGYYGNMDLTQSVNRTFSNMAILALRGMFTTLPLTAAAFFYHPDLGWALAPSVLAGVSFPFCYLAGIGIAKVVTLPLLTMFTEWAEFLYGGIIFTVMMSGIAGYYGS